MPTDALILVIAAALVHATWNAVLKVDGDRLALVKTMSCTQFVLSLALMPFVSLPEPAAWPYLTASAS